MILLKNYFVNTTAEIDVISIIHEINGAVKESGLTDALVTVSVPAPGAALTIIEPLPDIVEQLKEAVHIFPGMGLETKNRRKEEVAMGPRIVAAMLGKSLQVPVGKSRLLLGPREEVVLIDLESKGLRREFHVQVMGEKPQQAGGPQLRRVG